jgi:hypothetical protein
MTGPSIKEMVDSIMPQVMANQIMGGEPTPIDCKPLLDLIRKTVPNRIAEELLSVQPMDPTLGKQLMEGGMSEAQLIAEGYEPVSNMRLLWVQKA